MAIKKITSTDLQGKGVIGLPDAPGLSTAAMQEKFEETARSVIIPKVNEVIDEVNTGTVNNANKLGGVDASDYVRYGKLSGVIKIVDFSAGTGGRLYRFTGTAYARQTCILLFMAGQAETSPPICIAFGGGSGNMNLENAIINLSDTLNGIITKSGNSITIGSYGGNYGRHRFIILGEDNITITQEIL